MTHIAIVEEHTGESTQWMEKVSDEQYENKHEYEIKEDKYDASK